MTQLFAQPYDISASGFYFEDLESYRKQAAKAVNHYGQPVEEFEIQFIDGESLDCELAQAFGLNQANLEQFFDAVADLEEVEKQRIIIAAGECGYEIEGLLSDPDSVDLEIYYVNSMRDLAEQFVDEGLFGEIPERLQYYIDYDAIARDLEADYSETVIANEALIYRCG